jgi:hypothetical protein
METLFQVSNLYIMPFWLLMIFLPLWRGTQRIMASVWVLVPIALAYAVALVAVLAGNPGAAGDIANPSQGAIAALLGTPEGATVGWLHFLAFDLFVGRWVYLDSRKRAISAWFVSPALFFVLMSGPVGFLLYLGVRYLRVPRGAVQGAPA